jgi:leucine-zipper of insertion element IS481
VHLHGNARLVPSNRRLLVARLPEQQWGVADVAVAFGIRERTFYRWLARRRVAVACSSSTARRRTRATADSRS